MKNLNEKRRNDWVANRDFLQQFLDVSPNGVMIFFVHKDKNGAIADFEWRLVNLQSHKMLHRNQDSLVGKRFQHEFDTEEGQRLFHLAVRAMESGESTTTESNLGTNSWFLISFTKLDESLIMTLKDISQRQQMELERELEWEELDRFFKLSLDLLVVASTDGYFLKMNKAWEYCLGYSLESMQGIRFTDFVHPDDIESTTAAIQKLAMQEPVLNYVNRYRTIDGTYRYIEWRAQAFGNIIYAAGRDITEFRVADERLMESERRFRALFEQSNDAIILVDMNQNFHANRVAAELMGYSLDEMKQMRFEDLAISAQDGDKIRERLLSGQKIPLYERILKHRDGSDVAVEINVELVRDEQGRPYHIQAIVRDISGRKNAEKTLRESEQRFRALFEQSNDAVFILDFNAQHIAVNRKASDLLGYSVEELQNMGAHDISAEANSSANILQRLLSGEKIPPYERLFKHQDGSLIPVEINVELVYDEAGNPLHLQSVLRDIRDRKRIEFSQRAKLEQERDFQKMLKALQDIVIELSNIKSLDDFFRRAVELGLKHFDFERMGILLYEPPYAIGTYGTDGHGKILDERGNRIDPGDLTSILSRAMQREERFIFDADAELFSNYQSIGRGQNAVAVLWNGSEKLGWLAIDNGVEHRPISQSQLEMLALYALSLGNLLAQKRTQLSLEQSEARYRSVIAVLAEGIVVQDVNGVIQTWNDAAERILGLSASEMLGRSSFDPRWRAIHEDGSDFPGEDHPTIMTLKTGKPSINVVIGIHKPNGELVWLSVNAQPLFHPNESKPYGVVATLFDITRRKKAERQVIELQLEKERMQVLSNFIQGTSHEFRTPLAIIKSNTYLLKRLDDPEKRADKANAIEEQIQRILNLLTMLNKMSQLDSNTTMKLKQFNPIKIIKNVLQILHSEIEQKSLQIKLEGDVPQILGDEELLTDAFKELVRNAIQFSLKDGEIRVYLALYEEKLCISLEDFGIGMDESILPHIFERFYRMDAAHSTAGFGLGLPLAQSIVDKHGGEIRVWSELGKGSRFEVWLPLIKIQANPA